jgi:hypothetical protein
VASCLPRPSVVCLRAQVSSNVRHRNSPLVAHAIHTSLPQPSSPESSPWPARIFVAAFLAMAVYSVYLAAQLLLASCEGFSCTYLGMAWMFWLGALCLPATALGYFAQRAKTFSLRFRSAIRLAWQAHTAAALGLLAWWLLHRA